MKEYKLESYRTVNGFTFTYCEDNNMYECRGEVLRDHDGDEYPQPELWAAAEKLAAELKAEGYKEAGEAHSEKGWVEVMLD